MTVERICILNERTHLLDTEDDPPIDLGRGPDFFRSLFETNGWWTVYPSSYVAVTSSRLFVRRVGELPSMRGIYVACAVRDGVDDMSDLEAVAEYTLADYLTNPSAAAYRVVWDGTDIAHTIAGLPPIS